MRALVALALILALLVTIFAVQNNADMTVKVLVWSVRGSAALKPSSPMAETTGSGSG